MSNFEHSHQEHPEEQDPGIEIVDLEPSEPTDTLDKIKRDLLVRVEKKHLARPFLLKHGNVQLATLSGVVLVGLIVVLSVSGMFSFLLSHGTHPSTSPSSDILLLEQNTLRCLVDTAWSPDNHHIAVLGYGVDCQRGTSQYVPGLVNVYDGHSAELLEQVHPDAAILSTLKKQLKQFAGKQAPPFIFYQNMLWSPDGHYLALLFSAATSPKPTASRIDGVFLLGKDDKQHVFLRQETPEEAQFLPLVRWDIHQGVATVVPNPAFAVNSTGVISISASLSYHWGAGDVLVPDTQTGNASPSAPALSPVGNPDGESSFTTWQPGSIFYVIRGANGSLYVPGVYVWQTVFPAWSPDGRFLVQGLVAGVRLEVPGQKSLGPQALKDLGVDQLHVLQVHNKALVQVLHTLLSLSDTNGNSNAGLSIKVSWRPDGRLLAMDYAGKVDIYDCATGRKLASLVPAMPPDRLNGFQDVLRWSPDGTHLLLSSTDWGPMEFWGPGQLPK
jgi:WD40 repeat protein